MDNDPTHFMNQPPRVLIVEDDDDTAMLTAETLRKHFGAVCSSRVASLAELEKSELSLFDAVLCDYHLPDGVGMDALRVIRSRRPDMPVIMVTGQSEARHAVDAIREGAADYIVKTLDYLTTLPLVLEKNLTASRMLKENARLHEALRESLAELRSKNRDLEEAVSQLEMMAMTDPLTGLANRRHLTSRLVQMYAQAVRYDDDLACMMIDLDGFKSINDTLGHQRGDELLELTGRVINAEIRTADVAARFGGDEFVVLMPRTPAATAVALASRLQSAFQRHASRLADGNLRCGMSIGVACVSVSKPADGNELITHADNALYAAKQAGKRRIMMCGADGVTATPVDEIVAG
ncbi:MAG: diguanylate cyclase [Phycisphaerales bacterium]|nr:MAG: diguanylate cyclase [Phycisphaerales bacterium]